MYKLFPIILFFFFCSCNSKIAITESSNSTTENYYVASESGSFKLFGPKPSSFQIPKDDAFYTLQYIAELSKKDFPILPFKKLSIFCPEFLKGTLFIDYSNPNKPAYLNDEVIQKVNFPAENNFILKEYKPISLERKELESIQYAHAKSGNPEWLQYADVPKSPLTSKSMDFLIQFNFDPYEFNELASSEYIDYPPYMYVFIEPSTKLIAILLQVD